MTLADVPGIIEGAHTGRGLGREFLRHCQRARVLIHLIAGDSFSPIDDYDAINQELEMFSPELAVKPQVVAFTKMDTEDAMTKWKEEVEPALRQRGLITEIYCHMSLQPILPTFPSPQHILILRCGGYSNQRRKRSGFKGVDGENLGATRAISRGYHQKGELEPPSRRPSI